MASRGDMIRRARRRVDARREARNRANIRDQARANYGRNLIQCVKQVETLKN